MPDFFSLEEVLDFHLEQVALYGGDPGIRDVNLLQSAIAMPSAGFGEEYLHGEDGVRHIERDRTGKELVIVDPPRAEAKEAAAEAVPSGSVKEVLAWIGDNEDRAARALDAEYERDEPRVTVIEGIEKVIELEEE